MAILTPKSPDIFPPGTALSAYKASNWLQGELPPSGAAKGSADATGTVAADGTASLSPVTPDVLYFVEGTVGGAHKYLRMTASSSRDDAPESHLPTNVKDDLYGAKGDGVTDDLAAIQAAVTAVGAAGGGGVYLPAGTYLVSDRVTVDSNNVQLFGDGPASKIVLQAGTGKHNAVRFNTTSSSDPATMPRVTDCEMAFLSVDGKGGDVTWAAGGVPGTVVAYGCDRVRFHHLHVLNGRDYCLRAEGCADVSIADCTADGNYWQGASNPINVGGSSLVPGSDIVVRDCTVRNAITVTITGVTTTANTATFTTSAAHKMSASQPVKITGVDVAAYNGFWSVASAPTSTTFTVALGSTPAVGTGGTVRLIADRGIYVGGHNSVRVSAVGNNVDHATAGVTSEASGATESTDLRINGNTVSNFNLFGVGVSTSAGTPGLYAERCQINDNTVRGFDGTTTFGRAGSGSQAGVVIAGATMQANDNMVSNVRTGLTAGLSSWAIDEVNLEILGGVYVLATDATGQGIVVGHTDATGTALRRLKIQGVIVDGAFGTASDTGIDIVGNVIGFDIRGCTVRGMGRSGIKLEKSGSVAPSQGRIDGNICVDNGCASSTDINRAGIAIDSSVSDVVTSNNKCFDTRGGSALQKYGLHIAATATSIRSTNDDFTGNATSETNDASAAVGFWRNDYRDPSGIAGPFNIDPRISTASGSVGSANRIIYSRVTTGGGGLCSKIVVQVVAVDSGTPGTTDQIYVAVYGNTYGTYTGNVPNARTAKPNGRKATSGGVTATVGTNSISLGASVQINEGDWIAVGIASASTTVFGTVPSSGAACAGLNGFEDVTPPAPPTSPGANAGTGTSARTPVVFGIP